VSRRSPHPSPTPTGFPPHIARLADLYARLPGVGTTTANKFALWTALQPANVAHDLAVALAELHGIIGICARCNNLAERDPKAPASDPAICHVCADSKREDGMICVVATVEHLIAIERAQAMRGRYFVLGRLISPLEGVGLEDLPIAHLRLRIGYAGPGAEVMLALPVTVEGEATTMALARTLQRDGIRVTRLAAGMSYGADIAYVDAATVRKAVDGRVAT
jgi:recombination protein RecR